MVRINTHGTDPNKTGGTYIDAEGDYHLGIEGARDLSGQQPPVLEFDLVVLGSTAEGQIGKKHREKFNLVGGDEEKTKACHSRLMHFLCAIGLYSTKQWDEDVKAKRDFDFSVEDTIGLQFCAPITLRPGSQNPNMKFANLGFKFWAVGDEESDKIPKNADWIQVVADGRSALPTRTGDMRVPGTPSANGNGHGAKQHAPAGRPAASAPARQAAAPATAPAASAPRASTPPRAAVASVGDDIPF